MVDSLHIQLIAVSGGSFGCGFNCACVTEKDQGQNPVGKYLKQFSHLNHFGGVGEGTYSKADALELIPRNQWVWSGARVFPLHMV